MPDESEYTPRRKPDLSSLPAWMRSGGFTIALVDPDEHLR